MKYLFLLIFVPYAGKAQSKDSVTVMVPHFNKKGIQKFTPAFERMEKTVIILGTQAVFGYGDVKYEVSAIDNRLRIIKVKGYERDTLFLPQKVQK